jgi:hypothetical protein
MLEIIQVFATAIVAAVVFCFIAAKRFVVGRTAIVQAGVVVGVLVGPYMHFETFRRDTELDPDPECAWVEAPSVRGESCPT